MNYKSINELEKFSFEDCVITQMEVKEEVMMLELEALIVKPDNSQNTNYTESYAGTVQMRLINGKIVTAFKEGYKYYNANDELIKEKPDEILSEEQTQQLIKICPGAYLFSMKKKDETDGNYIYEIGIEFADEEETMADSYQLEVAFEKAIVEWDRYMNRVQR